MKKTIAAVLVFLAFCTAPGISEIAPKKKGEFVFARLAFNMDFSKGASRRPYNREGQVPWQHDYPYSEDLFLTMLKEVTGVHTDPESFQIVRLDSPEIFKYPFLYISEPGFMDLTDREVENFREYFNRGGFAMCDDFRAHDLVNLELEMKRVFPNREMTRMQLSHQVFKSFYDIDSLEMAPPYDNYIPEFWGLSDEKGRLIMIANQNNDFGEFWEYVDRGEMPFKPGAQSFKFGVNYLIYAMTH